MNKECPGRHGLYLLPLFSCLKRRECSELLSKNLDLMTSHYKSTSIKIVLVTDDVELCCFSAGGDDDFEMFLESVKARSLAARTRALPASGKCF